MIHQGHEDTQRKDLRKPSCSSWMYSPDHGQLCQVIEAQTLWGETTCRVWLPGRDSFAFSDPNRVQNLQRMLDLAATRGLQVIVLTCNPSDYAALGARQTILSPRSIQAIDAPSGQIGEPVDSADDDETPVASLDAALATDQDCEVFITALTDLGGKSGNQALRENLGWTDEHYSVLKERLIEQGLIVPGKGRGGSVALAE